MPPYTPAQRKAICNAFDQRLSLIQGPPGTGKTTMLCGIAASWVHKKDSKKILLCAHSNQATDMIAERLNTVKSLRDKIVRVYSSKVSTYDFDWGTVKDYSMVYRMEMDKGPLATRYKSLKEEVNKFDENYEKYWSLNRQITNQKYEEVWQTRELDNLEGQMHDLGGMYNYEKTY